MAWTDLILVGVLVAGVVIVMWARAGRLVLGRPRCAKCRHSLTGLEMESDARCPECGADLTGRDAVLFGHVAPQRWWLRLGILLVLGAVLVIGARTVRLHTDLDVAHLRPTSWVLRDLRRPERRTAVWRELGRRFNEGRLDDDAIAVAVDDMIAMMERGTVIRVGPPRTGRVIQQADMLTALMAEDRLSEQQMQRLTVAAFECGLTADLHPRARRGDWASFTVAIPLTQVLGEHRMIHLRAVRDADGNELPLGAATAGLGYGPTDHAREGLSAGGNTYLEGRVRAQLPPGEHELTFELELGATAEGIVPAKRPGPPERWPDTRQRWSTTRTARIETVDPKPGERVFDVVSPRPVGGDPIRRLVRIGGWRIDRQSGRDVASLDMRISSHKELTLAFDVILRFDGQERTFGRYTVVADAPARAGRPIGVAGLRSALPDDLSTIDVILRSNPTLVENTLGVDRVWNGELVFEDIPMVSSTPPPGPGSPDRRRHGAGIREHPGGHVIRVQCDAGSVVR